jgi:uncharacterized protein YeaO (DUF488 family)
VKALRDIIKAHSTVTILFGAHDEERNQAVLLAIYLRRSLRS